MKKQQRQKKVLIPSMYSANYSESKNMSVDTVCIKRLKFACMTIYDYSKSRDCIVVLCQFSTTDMQLPPVPNQPKNAELLDSKRNLSESENDISKPILNLHYGRISFALKSYHDVV